MKVGGAAIEMRVRRFASFVRATDEELGQASAALVTGSSRSLRRDGLAAAFPVDADTKLPLVRTDAAETPRPEPLLTPQTRSEVERVILERQAAEKADGCRLDARPLHTNTVERLRVSGEQVGMAADELAALIDAFHQFSVSDWSIR